MPLTKHKSMQRERAQRRLSEEGEETPALSRQTTGQSALSRMEAVSQNSLTRYKRMQEQLLLRKSGSTKLSSVPKKRSPCQSFSSGSYDDVPPGGWEMRRHDSLFDDDSSSNGS